MQQPLIQTTGSGLTPASAGGVIEAARAITASSLAPLTTRIDLEGLYPEAVMRELGAAGVFGAHLPSVHGGQGDLAAAIEAMGAISHECLSTGFLTWCQDTCAWYIENSENESLRREWLPEVAAARRLGGTGLSNPMKAFSGIEPLRLTAKPVSGGYVVNGALPWVSNLGADHVFGTVFRVEGDQPRHVMALIDCTSEGFTLRNCGPFTALEGTRTLSCGFKDVFVPESMIIADPVEPYLQRVRAGFILLQMGMGIGNAQACIDLMNAVEPQLGHVNAFLDDRPDELQEQLDDALEATRALAEDPSNTDPGYWREVLELRLAAAELVLRAAHSAMLHTGAKGYLQQGAAQRKLREAYFVAIVTPAIKHLRKELSQL